MLSRSPGASRSCWPQRRTRSEIVCDTDGHICQLLARACQHDPKGVAFHADYPTFHQDLRARHLWLRRWGKESADRLSEDPEWFDSRAAGWWVWGISSWIGGGWCQAVGDRTVDKRPLAKTKAGGQGVQMQRENLPVDKRPLVHANGGGPGVQVQRTGVPDTIPRVTSWPGGSGVQAQRTVVPWDKRPQVDSGGLGGRGVQAQRQRTPDKIPSLGIKPGGRGVQAQRDELAPEIGTGERLRGWFDHLAQRLARVVVLNRSWEVESFASDNAVTFYLWGVLLLSVGDGGPAAVRWILRSAMRPCVVCGGRRDAGHNLPADTALCGSCWNKQRASERRPC